MIEAFTLRGLAGISELTVSTGRPGYHGLRA